MSNQDIQTEIISQKNPKREKLKQISAIAKELQESEYPEYTINEILLNVIYQPEDEEAERLTFNTFNGWRAKGMRVKKGEKAFLIWGKKREAKKQELIEEGEKDSFKFFPLAFVFSNEQVENFKEKAEPVHEDQITGFYDIE